HPARDVDADRGDLARRGFEPHTGQSIDTSRIEPERGNRADDRLLEVAAVLPDVSTVTGQVEDRVADELPGAMEGRLAAPVGLDDLDLGGGGKVELAVLGAPSERDHRRMLDEDHRVRARAGENLGGDRSLERPGLLVANPTELNDVA